MTEIDQQEIVSLYKEGKTYREIWEKTGISPYSVASFLRRKHKNLQVLREVSRTKDATRFISLFVEKFHVPSYQAQAMYESILSRFEVKRQNARAKGQEFTILFRELDIPIVCPVLGIPLDYFAENHREDAYPTFDRVDNALGYISGNVQIVSWRANRLKNDGTAEEHRKIAEFMDRMLGNKV